MNVENPSNKLGSKAEIRQMSTTSMACRSKDKVFLQKKKKCMYT